MRELVIGDNDAKLLLSHGMVHDRMYNVKLLNNFVMYICFECFANPVISIVIAFLNMMKSPKAISYLSLIYLM